MCVCVSLVSGWNNGPSVSGIVKVLEYILHFRLSSFSNTVFLHALVDPDLVTKIPEFFFSCIINNTLSDYVELFRSTAFFINIRFLGEVVYDQLPYSR